MADPGRAGVGGSDVAGPISGRGPESSWAKFSDGPFFGRKRGQGPHQRPRFPEKAECCGNEMCHTRYLVGPLSGASHAAPAPGRRKGVRGDPLGRRRTASASRQSGVKIARNSRASYAPQTTCRPFPQTYFLCGRRSLDGRRSVDARAAAAAAAVQMVKKRSKGKSARGRPVIRAEAARDTAGEGGGRVLQE